LDYLHLFDNNLHGIFPPLLGANNSQLRKLELSDNQLTGSSPMELPRRQHPCRSEGLHYSDASLVGE